MKKSVAVSNINVMRYMGNKRRLLPQIRNTISQLARPGELVLDLMAGTHSVGFEMSGRNPIVANDIGAYTAPLGKALLQRPAGFQPDNYLEIIARAASENRTNGVYTFFQRHYADTYFSLQQCAEIDDLRYASEILEAYDLYASNLALSALISAMCYAQSTPGHFAQFMPSSHARVKTLRAISITDSFQERFRHWDIPESRWNNEVISEDWRVVFAAGFAENASVIYIDPPYNTEQYSRFYHVLETLVKYDYPELAFKAKYRAERFKSQFCYKRTVKEEFRQLFETAATASDADIVLSYSSTGIVDRVDFATLCQPHYKLVKTEAIQHPHSTQGKGMKKDVEELLLTFKQL